MLKINEVLYRAANLNTLYQNCQKSKSRLELSRILFDLYSFGKNDFLNFCFLDPVQQTGAVHDEKEVRQVWWKNCIFNFHSEKKLRSSKIDQPSEMLNSNRNFFLHTNDFILIPFLITYHNCESYWYVGSTIYRWAFHRYLIIYRVYKVNIPKTKNWQNN